VPDDAAHSLTAPIRRPRIADVAEAAGVSKTAVSFAFNDPERLSEATAARIRAVADELGYRPHPVARMLTRRRTMTIGLLTPQDLATAFANPFLAMFCQGLGRLADTWGYALHVISPVDGSLARAIDRATVDGFVVIGLAADHPEIGRILRVGLPVVLVDSHREDADSIRIDDKGGAKAAARHLVALGHRSFVVLAIESKLHPADTVIGRRLDGYREGLGEAGIELDDGAVVHGQATIEGGRAAFRSAHRAGFRPTAVLAMSDAIAIGAIAAAREIGLSVPGDVSVVGFDDIDLARLIDPPLTTVAQPVVRKGEEAVRLLMASIERGADRVPVHTMLETRLIVRASTGPAPASRGR
jgi:alanine racemase